ncbi:MAG: hypothetical protein Dbin4_02034 [Alphaproteobacteria bacterium]|nr:hypothetical protein [Alphaproteobacteria bacterium]
MKNGQITRRICAASAFALLGSASAWAASPPEYFFSRVGDAFGGGKPIFVARMRYENVDQSGLLNTQGDALTLRTVLGYETASINNFTGTLELEDIRAVTDNYDYNDGVNRRPTYPQILDRENTELNRAQIAYAGVPKNLLTVGRQRVILDNERFVGNVGWRQNEQTYDGVRLDNTYLPNTAFSYLYINRVNRFLGEDNPLGNFKGDIHLINLSYNVVLGGFNWGKATAYSYLLDMENAPALTTETYGGRFAGAHPITHSWKVLYGAEYASQTDYQSNPLNFSNDYYMGELGLTKDRLLGGSLTGTVNMEVLSAEKGVGFSTPLATGHKFAGWADVFTAATPGTGLEDREAMLVYTKKQILGIDVLRLTAAYHDFESDGGNIDYGDETNLMVTADVWKRVVLLAKYANYDAERFATDRKKIWFSAEIRY